MTTRSIPLALFAAIALAPSDVRAQVLPPPRVVPGQTPYRLYGVLPPAGKPLPTLPLASLPYPPPGYQPSAYQVWQNYGVTYNGWLRPRIVQSPYDGYGYWLYNGAPFPYVYTMPGRHRPSVAPIGAPTP